MKHHFIDRYSYLNSPLHQVDPRVKIITLVTFILFIIFTPPVSFISFGFYAILILALILISRVPAGFVFKRSLVVIPFVLMAVVFIPFLKEGEIAGSYSLGKFRLTVSYEGLTLLWNVAVKSYLSTLCLVLLSSTTSFTHLLKAMDCLKFPRIITMILSFMYRYIFVLVDELMSMKRAKDSRTVGRMKNISNMKTLGRMMGTFFLRSYERGERIYTAMVSRGFDGQVKTFHPFRLKKHDIGCSILFVTMLCLIRWRG